MSINLKALLETMKSERSEKYKSGLKALKKALDLFGPDFMKKAEKTALGGMEASMVSRGLGGSVMPGKLSTGLRASFEDTRREGRAGALSNLGRYIQRGTPSAGDIAHLATGGFSGLLGQAQLDFQKSLINPDWLALQSGGGSSTGLGSKGLGSFL